MNQFFYVYVLLSQKDKKFYTGYTKNLKVRFDEHSSGCVKSTQNRLPLSLIYYEACLNKKDAIHREEYLKTHHGKKIYTKQNQIIFNRVILNNYKKIE